MTFYASLDLGKAHDYSVLTIIQKTSHLDIVHCNRFRRGMSYQKVAETTISRVKRLRGDKVLAIDMGGVGMSVAEHFENVPFEMVHMTYTGGKIPSYEGRKWNVPKFHVISTANMEISEGRVRIATGIKDSKGLIEELAGYRMKLSAGGSATFSNDRAVGFDDRVTSLATALYVAVKLGSGEPGLQLDTPISFGCLPFGDERSPATDAYAFQHMNCEQLGEYLENES